MTKEELRNKVNTLEDRRENYVQALEKAYERADKIKRKIFNLDQELKELSNKIRRC